MTPLVIRYPLDPTGVSPNHRVQGEVRQLVDRPRRAVVPMYGYFYTKSLVIHDNKRLFKLERNVHYDIMGLNPIASARFGKEVAAIIVIKSKAVSDEISFTYQVVGSEEFQSVLNLAVEVTKNLTDDDRELVWEAISGRPSSYYPAHHFHDIGDAYAFDPLVNAFETLKDISLATDRASQDDLYLNVDQRLVQLSRQVQNRGDVFATEHEANPDAHVQYAKTTTITGQRPMIRRPVNKLPLLNAVNVPIKPTLTPGAYYSAYRVPLRLMQFQISRTQDFAIILDDSGPIRPVASYTSQATLLFNTDHFWRHRFNDEDNTNSDWSTPTRFRTVGN